MITPRCCHTSACVSGAVRGQRSAHVGAAHAARRCCRPRPLAQRVPAAMAAAGQATSRLAAFWNHPAGPKTIHFWAPTFKWGITFANIADLQRPPEKLSYPQQIAITATGLIWSRYSTQITPVNYNLLAVNFFMAITGSYQLSRKLRADYGGSSPAPAAA